MGEGEGGVVWENGTETHILSYVKQVASPGPMHEAGCLGRVHWDDPEGRDGKGGGRGAQDGEHMYTTADSSQYMAKPIQYCKAISLQLNKFILKTKQN